MGGDGYVCEYVRAYACACLCVYSRACEHGDVTALISYKNRRQFSILVVSNVSIIYVKQLACNKLLLSPRFVRPFPFTV